MRSRNYDHVLLCRVPDRFEQEYCNTPDEDKSEWIMWACASFLCYLEDIGYMVDTSLIRVMVDYSCGKNYLAEETLEFDEIERQIPDYILNYNYRIRNVFYNGISLFIHI